MEHISWKCLVFIVIFGFCNVILAAPAGDQTSADSNYELSPLASAEVSKSYIFSSIHFEFDTIYDCIFIIIFHLLFVPN